MDLRISLLCLTSLMLLGCNSYDSDFIPYGLTGFDVYVYNNRTDQEHYAGRVDANYLSRREGISQCQDTAADEAAHLHLADWSYICCTVTSSSSCVTKVQ